MVKQNAVNNIYGEYGETLASGANYTMTTAFATLTFGSGALQITLPNPGTYEVGVEIFENLSGVTASAAANYSDFRIGVGGSYTLATRRGVSFPILGAALGGINQILHHFTWIVTTAAASQVVNIQGKYNSAVTGTWEIIALGQTRLWYRRIE